jgi:hypothetical protein
MSVVLLYNMGLWLVVDRKVHNGTCTCMQVANLKSQKIMIVGCDSATRSNPLPHIHDTLFYCSEVLKQIFTLVGGSLAAPTSKCDDCTQIQRTLLYVCI